MRRHYKIAGLISPPIAWAVYLLGAHNSLFLACAVGSSLCTLLAYASEKKGQRIS